MRPDKPQERIGHEEQHQHDLDFPFQRRDMFQIELARDARQLIGIADQREPAADGDHAGRGEKGRALAQ